MAADHAKVTGETHTAVRLQRALSVEMVRRGLPSPGTPTDWRVDSPTWSTSSILMFWCSAEACQTCPISTSSYPN